LIKGVQVPLAEDDFEDHHHSGSWGFDRVIAVKISDGRVATFALPD
jgi:hypothetical protein